MIDNIHQHLIVIKLHKTVTLFKVRKVKEIFKLMEHQRFSRPRPLSPSKDVTCHIKDKFRERRYFLPDVKSLAASMCKNINPYFEKKKKNVLTHAHNFVISLQTQNSHQHILIVSEKVTKANFSLQNATDVIGLHEAAPLWTNHTDNW